VIASFRRRKLRERSGGRCLLPQLRQTKVQELRTRLGQHDVAGLQITVRDSLAVRLVERVGDLDGVLQNLFERKRTFLEAFRQRLPFEMLHHQEISAVLVPDVVEGADVRMVQAGDGASFALEALAQFGSIGKVIRKDFDGNGALQTRIAGAVHLTHPTRTNRGEDFIGPEALATEDRHASPAELKLPMIPCGRSPQSIFLRAWAWRIDGVSSSGTQESLDFVPYVVTNKLSELQDRYGHPAPWFGAMH